MKKKALKKEFHMEIKKSLNRFLSIFFIVAMGVAFFSGIQASAPDMRATGDYYFDENNLMDIKVLGTLGLTQEDIEAIAGTKGVARAVGSYMEDVYCGEEDARQVLHVEALTEGINEPAIEEGRLPEGPGECFLDAVYAQKQGCQVGDTLKITVSSEEDTTLRRTEFTICGIGNSPCYVAFERGSTTLGSGSVAGFAYVLPEEFDSEVYHVAYVQVAGAKEEVAYTDGYEELVDAVFERVEGLENARCEIRYQEVNDEAQEKIADAKQEVADGRQEVADAKQDLEDGRREAESELSEAESELTDGEAELAEGRQKLEDAKQELVDGEAEISDGESEISDHARKLEDARAQMNDGISQLRDGESEYQDGLATYQKEKTAAQKKLGDAQKQIDDGKEQLEDGWEQYRAQLGILEENAAKLDEARGQLDASQQQYEDGAAQLASGWQAYEAGAAEVSAARQSCEDGAAQLAAGQQAYEAGAAELASGWQAYEDGASRLASERQAYETGAAQLAAGRQEYEDGASQLAFGRQAYESGMAELASGWQAYESGVAELASGRQAYESGRAQLAADQAAYETHAGEVAALQQECAQIQQEIDKLASFESPSEEQQKRLEELKANLAAGQGELQQKQDTLESEKAALEQTAGALDASKAELDTKESELAAGKETLDTEEAKLAASKTMLDAKEAELAVAKQTLDAKESELAAAKTELDTAEAQLAGTKQTLNEKESELAAAKTELDARESELAAARTEVAAAETQLDATKETLDAKQSELDAARTKLEDGWAELNTGEVQIESGREQLAAAKTELEENEQQLVDAQKEVDSGRQELSLAEKKLRAARKKLDVGWAELNASRSQMTDGENQLADAREKLAKARQTLADGRREIADAEKEIAENEQKLADGWEDYEEGKKEAQEKIADGEQKIADAEQELADAEQKIADAEQELADLRYPKWYVYDRNELPDNAGFGDNADRLTNIAKVFPVIFFLVAALISLTTMTRMVEEERTQIGTMKALGYSKKDIAGKYLKYAFFATMGGSVFGVLIGEKIFPWIIVNAYGIMYQYLPKIIIPYDWKFGIMATGAALLCTMAATCSACFRELQAVPAQLMRPPAPKDGKRVWLEYLPFIWKRLGFIWKSTVRNLMRYKKRFLMTVIGIGGCMGLLLVGFGLRDSIMDVAALQFDELQVYDAMVVVDTDASAKEQEKVEERLKEDGRVVTGKRFLMEKIEAKDPANSRKEWAIYLYVPENLEDLDSYLCFHDRVSKTRYELTEEGAIVTEKIAKEFGVKAGDVITLETSDEKVEIPVTAVTENYLNHAVYLTPALYQKIYKRAPEYNCLLFRTDQGLEEAREVGEAMLRQDAVLNVTYTKSLKEQLDHMLGALDIVIVVLIVSAGMLAFVVLYNLNNININERKRELATIKVLGFYDGEVAAYVYRENILLTIIGAAVGIFIGKFLHLFIIQTVEVDMCMFGRTIKPASYLIGTLFTFGFSILVNAVMYFKLKKIDMVESLKSVE